MERFHLLVVELYLFKVGVVIYRSGEDFSEPIVQYQRIGEFQPIGQFSHKLAILTIFHETGDNLSLVF
jgi:hypothetical protein